MKGTGEVCSLPVVFLDSGRRVLGKAVVHFMSEYQWKPGGAVFVCPFCGSAWGSSRVVGDWKQRFQALSIPCRWHGGGIYTAKICEGVYKDFDLEYDADILKEDFITMYDYWLRGKVEPAPDEEGLGEPTICVGSGENNLPVMVR